MTNYMKLEISAVGENESFARSVVAGFSLPLNPTLTELSDIKTAVSEAVTNSVVHGYKKQGEDKLVTIECRICQNADSGLGELHIVVTGFHYACRRGTFGYGLYHYASVYARM